MLEVGETAPDFQLLGTDGGNVRSYRLSDYTADGPVLLRFYPGDFSAVCGDKLCEFRDMEWLTVNPDVTVFGVSTDTIPAHQAFVAELDLNFPLLSDNNGTVSKQYGVCLEEVAGHRIDGALHAVYIVDPDRQVQYAWSFETPDIPDLETFNRMKASQSPDAIQPELGDIHDALADLVELPQEPF